jgi:DNA-directed RNA polymerase specialized sigma24 family protein
VVHGGWQQRIVVRILHGESGALAELYDRVAGRVYRIAVMMTGSITAAEQITEAVFLEAWRHPESLVSHQNQLEDYLSHQACQQGALRRTRHITPDAWASYGNS